MFSVAYMECSLANGEENGTFDYKLWKFQKGNNLVHKSLGDKSLGFFVWEESNNTESTDNEIVVE